jgi:hypothetical protein
MAPFRSKLPSPRAPGGKCITFNPRDASAEQGTRTVTNREHVDREKGWHIFVFIIEEFIST